MAGGLLDGLAHFIIAVDVEHVRDEVERILVILNLGIQTCEVEPVGQVFLVDFAKVLVASGGDELFVNPTGQRSRSLVRMPRRKGRLKNAFVGYQVHGDILAWGANWKESEGIWCMSISCPDAGTD